MTSTILFCIIEFTVQVYLVNVLVCLFIIVFAVHSKYCVLTNFVFVIYLP